MDMYDILLARNLGSGEGSTTNYNALSNKPEINGVPLQGNKTTEDLGLGTAAEKDYTNTVEDGSADLPTADAVHDFVAAQVAYIDNSIDDVQEQVDTIREIIQTELYGFKIDKQDSNPETRVTYLYDAVGKYPAGMDFVNGVFRYGGWADAWFVKGAKPCALRPDGTVAYYLNPNDYTKKEDGTDSDISDTTTDLNFMVQFPTVWIKRWEDARYQYVAISNKQIDDDFKAYAHMSEDGYVNDYVYFPMFKGSNIDDKMRSIAGQYPQTSTNASNTFSLARANGNDWYNWALSGRAMINDLLTLISKATNSQMVFGNGAMYDTSDATHLGMIETGADDLTTGQFFGYTGLEYSKHVKVFHIEDYWGNRAERVLGLHLNDGLYKYKLIPPYHSAGGGGLPYIQTALECADVGFFSEMHTGDFGFLPKPSETAGGGSLYWCDYFNCTKSGNMVSIVPFHSKATPTRNGYEALSIHIEVIYSSALVGGSLMYIPPHSA